MTKFTTGFFITVALCVSFTTNAARPSFTSLQQQINQLQAENNAQQAQIDALPKSAIWVDANGVMIGDAQDSADIFFEVNDELYYARLENDAFIGELQYDKPGCIGNVYNKSWAAGQSRGGAMPLVTLRDGILYTRESDAPQTVTLESRWLEQAGIAECADYNFPAPEDAYPVAPLIDTNIYAKPYKLKLIPVN